MNFDKEHTIGIILPNITNQFSSNFVTLMTATLEKNGVRAVVSLTNHDIEKERECFSFFQSTTNGIFVLSSAIEYSQIQDVVPSDIPVIFFNRKPENCEKCCILASDYSAIYQAIISMQRSENSRIACVCDNPGYSTTKEITTAYRDAIKNLDVGFTEDWILYTDNQSFSVEKLVEQISALGCNAVLTATQTLTHAFQEYLTLYNSHNDNKIYLIGYSNEEILSLEQYKIDTITQPVNQIVQLAVQQLYYLLDNPDTAAKDYLVKGTFRVKSFQKFTDEQIYK